MIKLKDYLGTLISSVNQARVMADIESARIAQIYANDNLLKHFSIPRFRAQDIELDIPIAIDSFDEEPVKDYQPIDNKTYNSYAYTVMKDIAQVTSFSRETSQLTYSEIAENSRELELDLKAKTTKEIAYSKYEKNMVSIFLNAIKIEQLKIENLDDTLEVFKSSLKDKLYNTIQSQETVQQLDNANVIVEAEKLREIPNENVIRVKMKLFEDGMEWHTSENTNGDTESRLLPE